MLSKQGTPAQELIAGGEWFNTKPLTLASLKGKVVIVDFWTYTCINCIRTLPYLADWYNKYHDKGLVIIGVHTPEFAFEKNADNVKKAIADFHIAYPVMQDNNYATWRAYNNHYWPAKYFIDKNGQVRATHFGEGEYDESEKIIQNLLAETGRQVNVPINNKTYAIDAFTPETYVGYNRLEYLAPPQDVSPDTAVRYRKPDNIPLNTFAFDGTWTVGGEYAMPNADSALTFHFKSKNMFLVMRPHTLGKTGAVKVVLDGKVISGGDVKNGIVTVDADRLYTLLQSSSAGEHTIRLEFSGDTVELFAFTFG